jgi:hypothetical protein
MGRAGDRERRPIMNAVRGVFSRGAWRSPRISAPYVITDVFPLHEEHLR